MRRCAREFHRLEDCEQASKWSGSKKKIDERGLGEKKKGGGACRLCFDAAHS